MFDFVWVRWPNNLKGGDRMLLNFILFTVKIERKLSSKEERLARFQEEQLINARNEADQNRAVCVPEFASRL